MTDRELLELAAKAAGLNVEFGTLEDWTDRPGARYVNAKGNPRYLCPKCAAAPGFKLPKGWRAVEC